MHFRKVAQLGHLSQQTERPIYRSFSQSSKTKRSINIDEFDTICLSNKNRQEINFFHRRAQMPRVRAVLYPVSCGTAYNDLQY